MRTATAAAEILLRISREFEWSVSESSPFLEQRIRAAQIDGGSEFSLNSSTPASSAAALFVLQAPPNLHGAVERAERTHTEEIYVVTICSLEIAG
jgi:hypothetical protein